MPEFKTFISNTKQGGCVQVSPSRDMSFHDLSFKDAQGGRCAEFTVILSQDEIKHLYASLETYINHHIK